MRFSVLLKSYVGPALGGGLQLLELGLVEATMLAVPPPFLVLSDVLKLWILLRRIEV